MGLDISFFKTTKGAYQEHQEALRKHWGELNPNISNQDYEALPKDERAKYDKLFDTAPHFGSRLEEIGDFRKVNLIVSFFNYEDNCSYMVIQKDKINELLDACNAVLGDHDKAEEFLPTQSGFFFGSTDYDEWYFKNVERVRNWCVETLRDTDWENEDILLWCWW